MFGQLFALALNENLSAEEFTSASTVVVDSFSRRIETLSACMDKIDDPGHQAEYLSMVLPVLFL